MPEAAEPHTPFFVAGGTLPAEAGSYVEREADARLFASLSEGKFCYVLNSRQMGKSSLCVRAMGRLDAAGVQTAFVDLTKIGGRNVTPEQWYAGVLVEIGRSLDLRAETLAYWKENAHLSPVQRLFGALREVVLEKISHPVAIFFDEIDATRSLPFSADEFFAAIRECFNRRVQDGEFKRLTFCLLGVAVPSDLINNPTSTPFNVGERIYLKDFTLEEAAALARGLSPQSPSANPKPLLDRVFYWTNGHPYITQSLCLAIAADPSIHTPEDVDALVKRDLFEPKARETNINLADVANRAIHGGDLEDNPEKFRADLLSAYESARNGKSVPDDESNRVAVLLKLSGMTRSESNRLVVRNRIYWAVFDRSWIRQNMPGQEVRRRTKAYWLGVVRTGVIGGLVIGLVSVLAVRDRQLAARNEQLAKDAVKAQEAAEYQAYVANLNAMRTADSDHNSVLLAKLLDETRDSPYRGIEWEYWSSLIHDASAEISFPSERGRVVISPDGKTAEVIDLYTNSGFVYTYPGLVRINKISPAVPSSIHTYLLDRWVTIEYSNLNTVNLTDSITGQLIGVAKVPEAATVRATSCSDGSALGLLWAKSLTAPTTNLTVWVSAPPRRRYEFDLGGREIWQDIISHDGKFALLVIGNGGDSTGKFVIADLEKHAELARLDFPGESAWGTAISNDGGLVAIGFYSGRVVVYDVRHRNKVLDKLVFQTPVQRLRFDSANGRLFAVGDQTVRIYELASGRRELFEHRGGWDAAFAPDGKSFATIGDGCRIFEVKPTPKSSNLLKPSAILGVDATDRPVVVSAPSGDVQAVNSETLSPVGPTTRIGPAGDVDNAFWRCIRDGGGVSVVSMFGDRRLCRLQGIKLLPYAISPTQSGSQIVTIDATGSEVQAFDSSGRLTWTYDRGGDKWVWCLYAPDGLTVAALTEKNTLAFIDGKRGLALRSLNWPSTGGTRAAFSNHGRRFTYVVEDEVHVVDLASNAPEIVLFGHSARIVRVSFSPDDSRILTASSDGTIRLWDSATGAQLLTLGSGRIGIISAVFDNEGKRIFSTDEKGNFTVYRLSAAR